jgi:hypothetical protein
MMVGRTGEPNSQLSEACVAWPEGGSELPTQLRALARAAANSATGGGGGGGQSRAVSRDARPRARVAAPHTYGDR